MLRHFCLKNLIAGMVLASGMLTLGSSPVWASGYCPPPCHYERVTVYVPKTITCTKLVTLYDHCGRPYQVERTYTTTVQVAVTKLVAVYD